MSRRSNASCAGRIYESKKKKNLFKNGAHKIKMFFFFYRGKEGTQRRVDLLKRADAADRLEADVLVEGEARAAGSWLAGDEPIPLLVTLKVHPRVVEQLLDARLGVGRDLHDRHLCALADRRDTAREDGPLVRDSVEPESAGRFE